MWSYPIRFVGNFPGWTNYWASFYTTPVHLCFPFLLYIKMMLCSLSRTYSFGVQFVVHWNATTQPQTQKLSLNACHLFLRSFYERDRPQTGRRDLIQICYLSVSNLYLSHLIHRESPMVHNISSPVSFLCLPSSYIWFQILGDSSDLSSHFFVQRFFSSSLWRTILTKISKYFHYGWY